MTSRITILNTCSRTTSAMQRLIPAARHKPHNPGAQWEQSVGEWARRAAPWGSQLAQGKGLSSIRLDVKPASS